MTRVIPTMHKNLEDPEILKSEERSTLAKINKNKPCGIVNKDAISLK